MPLLKKKNKFVYRRGIRGKKKERRRSRRRIRRRRKSRRIIKKKDNNEYKKKASCDKQSNNIDITFNCGISAGPTSMNNSYKLEIAG